MRSTLCTLFLTVTLGPALAPALAPAQNTQGTPTFRKLNTYLHSVAASDTHYHLWPFNQLPGYVETAEGKGMNLAGLWRNSYLTRIKSITPWQAGMKFDDWWGEAKHDFSDVSAASLYRLQ